MMTGGILRMLDANCNRAREALRVLEDVARFALDDPSLQSRLKQLRHDLTAATANVADGALVHRDTANDVGTASTTPAELVRVDLSAIARAASKRLGEALRVVEESLKALSAASASLVEQTRYRFYDIETDLLLALRPRVRFADVRLYVIVTEAACSRPWLEAAELAIRGGADCLQLREKHLDGAELLARAQRLVELCRRHRVLCIVNDRVDIALLSGADGVHVGQTDLPARDARRLVGDGLIVGVSTHSVEHARQAQRDGADYVGVGPLFPSPTKPRDFTLGPDGAAEIVRGIPLPTVGIAGVTLDNLDEALRSGVQAIAVASSVVGAPDVRAAAAEFKRRLLLARPRDRDGD